MPTITGSNSFPETFEIPDAGDLNWSPTLNSGIEDIADRTVWLKTAVEEVSANGGGGGSGGIANLSGSSIFELQDVSGAPTDGQILSYSDALSAFVPVENSGGSGTGSASGSNVITTVEADGSSSSVSVTIDATEEVDIEFLCPPLGSGGTGLFIYINGDETNTNYYFQKVRGYNSTVTANEGNTPNFSRIDDTYNSIVIGSARISDSHVSIFFRGSSTESPASMYYETGTVVKTTTDSNITTIKIATSGTNIPNGAKLIVRNPSAAGTPNDDYSTSETTTNKKWIDGKTIYRKVVDLGTLSDGTGLGYTDTAHGITGLDTMISLTGIAISTTGTKFPLPFSNSTTAPDGSIMMFIPGAAPTIIRVDVGTTDRSSFTTAYAILEYTKT